MGAEAAGAYLWALRKSKRMSRDAAASKLNTSRSQIERMEYGNGDTLAPMYMAFIRLVEGDMEHVADLLLGDETTAEDGERKALEFLSTSKRYIPAFLREVSIISAIGSLFKKNEDYLTNEERTQISELFAALSDEQLESITEIAQRIHNDPKSVLWVLGFIQGLAGAMLERRVDEKDTS